MREEQGEAGWEGLVLPRFFSDSLRSSPTTESLEQAIVNQRREIFPNNFSSRRGYLRFR